MSAHIAYDSSPSGSTIRHFDGRQGRRRVRESEMALKKEPPRSRSSYSSPARFILHEGDFGEGGVIVVSVRRTWPVESELRFEIVEHPAIGLVRVLQEIGGSPWLLNLASDREAAERWFTDKPYRRAYLEEVAADEIGGRGSAPSGNKRAQLVRYIWLLCLQVRYFRHDVASIFGDRRHRRRHRW